MTASICSYILTIQNVQVRSVSPTQGLNGILRTDDNDEPEGIRIEIPGENAVAPEILQVELRVVIRWRQSREGLIQCNR